MLLGLRQLHPAEGNQNFWIPSVLFGPKRNVRTDWQLQEAKNSLKFEYNYGKR